ncbi:hypothetical protein HOK021_67690 [Streptomyces hygroscopicus]|nr:hypothetical protein HOK021_67690 [Streptomyces hygroscopicus]
MEEEYARPLFALLQAAADLGRVGEFPGGEAYTAHPCHIDALNHVPWHPQSSLEQLHTIEPLFERTVPARNTPRSSDLGQGLAAAATGRHLPGGGPYREGGLWGKTLGARGSGSWVGDMGRQGPGCSQRRGPDCLRFAWMHPNPLPGQDRPMHGHASA